MPKECLSYSKKKKKLNNAVLEVVPQVLTPRINFLIRHLSFRKSRGSNSLSAVEQMRELQLAACFSKGTFYLTNYLKSTEEAVLTVTVTV